MFWLQFCLTIETFYLIWQPLKLWYDFALCFVYLIASSQDMIVKSAELHIPPTSLDFSGIGNLYYYFKAKNVKDQFLKLKLLSTRYKTDLIEPAQWWGTRGSWTRKWRIGPNLNLDETVHRL